MNKARFCAFSSTLPFKSTSSTASQLNMGKLRPSGILAGLKHLLIHVTIILFTICWKGNFFPSERINCDNFEAFEEKKIIYRFGFERKLRHLLIFCGLSLFCKPCKYEVEDFLSCLHSHLPILFYSTAQKNLSFDPVLEKEIEG